MASSPVSKSDVDRSIAPASLTGCDRRVSLSTAGAHTPVNTPVGQKHVAPENLGTNSGFVEPGIAPCTADGCAYDVHWVAGNTPASSIALPVPGVNQSVQWR
jgi:hypothetical protein